MCPPFCLTTSCKRTLAFVITFRHKSSESARHSFTMWALSCATFSGLLWKTFSFKNPHKKKSHGLISGLWGGHSCTDTCGTRPPLHQHRTIIFKLLAKSVNFLFARSPPCTKVCTKNVSESLLHSLFLHKTIQLSHFDLQSTARCPPFYKLLTSITFSVNYSIHSHVCNIDTMMLQF